MDKLTIEHLAPYLPYNLNLRHYSGIVICMGIAKRRVEGEMHINNVLEGLAKPLLLPLSYLTKEIAHEGRSFVPLEQIQMFCDEIDSFNLATLTFYVENYEKQLMQHISIMDMPYSVIKYLISLHFDIYQLIPKNLAIDKSTITT